MLELVNPGAQGSRIGEGEDRWGDSGEGQMPGGGNEDLPKPSALKQDCGKD